MDLSKWNKNKAADNNQVFACARIEFFNKYVDGKTPDRRKIRQHQVKSKAPTMPATWLSTFGAVSFVLAVGSATTDNEPIE